VVASPTVAVMAVRKATKSIPIVGVNLTDPIRFGLIDSDARPGGNVTGIISRLAGLPGKQLEMALDLLPGAKKIGVLATVGNPSTAVQRGEIVVAAAKVGIELRSIEVENAGAVSGAFETLVRDDCSLVLVLADSMFLNLRRQIAAQALVARTPTVYSFREHVEDGGLISYGVNVRENYRRASYFVHRLLKGENPAELPVEFPTKVEVVINLVVRVTRTEGTVFSA
jgi:putative ABC transport system substrate-binding protein